MFRFLTILTFLALALSACGSGASSPGRTAPVVLASTSILADITRRVAGGRLEVDSLLPVGTDPHSYQPVPADVAKIGDSSLLVVNGLGYERFLESLLENAGGEHRVITASDGLEPLKVEDEADAGQFLGDPHMWLDPSRVVVYVENIREGLTRIDPEGAAVYRSNAEAYAAQLGDLDAWIVEQVSQVSPERRLLVTNHETLGYFSDRYGFTIIGAVAPSLSSDASPSAGQMAGLIEQIKATGAPAIFVDEVDNPALARQIAEETGVKVVQDLHFESLTGGPPAATYIDMMRHDVRLIVNALK